MSHYDFYVVGIGSSAGGIPPLKTLVSRLPKDLNAAIVLIPHLYAEFRSRLDEILRKCSEMPIVRVEKSILLNPGNIYLLSENKMMSLDGGVLVIRDRLPEEKINHAIDIFFKSLAKEVNTKAIGIVLSGTNADGSEGAKAISAAGGLVMTQDPHTAIHPQMPLEVIRRDNPKLVAPIEVITNAIIEKVERSTEKIRLYR
jgi:two-component system, chemotaxis family, protein-glutamate methylesterase/glutaminase